MTPEELARIEQACSEASPGTWIRRTFRSKDEWCHIEIVDPASRMIAGVVGQPFGPKCDHKALNQALADGTFIVTAHNTMPKMLAYIRELERLLRDKTG